MERIRLLLLPALASAITCPGFPGYCSEAFPGNFCNVVCSRGRANVPLCQDDGTWTDIPRCIEHEPGIEEQVPGLCPGVPGYCSVGFLYTQCKFDCLTGADVDSICSADGTWAPYPTCEGDYRETQDGCDGCPGPLGGSRNRTAEAIVSANTISDRRVPKVVSGDGGRKTIPSFAGNINIGPLDVEEKPFTSFRTTSRRPPPSRPPTTTRAPTTTTTTSSVGVRRRPVVSTFRQPGSQSKPRPQPAPRPTPQPAPRPAPPGPTLSLFDRIKARTKKGSAQSSSAAPPTPRPTQGFSLPQVPAPRPTLSSSGSTFGVFDEVELLFPGQPALAPKASFPAVPRRPRQPKQPGQPVPYGEFQTVNLQG